MPTKIVVTHEGLAHKQYGTGWVKVKAAVQTLIAADAARGIQTKFVALDDPSFGKWRAKANSQASFKQAIDHAYFINQKPDYVTILGGPDLVAYPDLRNPLTGEDADDDPLVPSDLPYACDAPHSTRVADFIGPSRVVGRIPDHPGSSDPARLVALLKAAAAWKPKKTASKSYFGLSAQIWNGSTTMSLKAIFGGAGTARLSPLDGPAWTKTDLKPDWHFINCHGAPADPQFYGQKANSYPVAHQAPVLAKKVTKGAVAAAECCYGAELYDLSDGPTSICVSYLDAGAIGFLGSTTIAYGPANSNASADLICQYFIGYARKGASLGSALLQARLQFVKASAPLSPVDLKTLAQFLLLGDSSIRAVATGDPKITAKSFSAHAARRRQLDSDAQLVMRGADVASSESQPLTSSAIHSKLAEAAADEGFHLTGQPHAFRVRPAQDQLARNMVAAKAPAVETFHVMYAHPNGAPAPKAKSRQARKAAPSNAEPAVPRRLLLLGKEVAGKLVKVERLYAHLQDRSMKESFEGWVVKRRMSPGSKSDREAVVLETDGESLVLRRRGGNAFSDPQLDELVGHRIRGTGQRTGYTLILGEWTDLGKAKP